VGQDCILQAGFSTGLLLLSNPVRAAPMKIGAQLAKLPHRAAEPQPKRGANALVRAGPPGPAFHVFEQADQGVGRGPGGPPHKIVAGGEEIKVL